MHGLWSFTAWGLRWQNLGCKAEELELLWGTWCVALEVGCLEFGAPGVPRPWARHKWLVTLFSIKVFFKGCVEISGSGFGARDFNV